MNKPRATIKPSGLLESHGSSTRHAKFNADAKRHALRVIEACGRSLSRASERLGISIPTLSRWKRSA
jgi:hypothetical protein